MIENFDDTQFLTFDIRNASTDILIEIKKRFSSVGFKILIGEEIENVKKDYFRKYLRTIFIELEDKEFIGDIAHWEEKNLPTERVTEFERNIIWLCNQRSITDLKVILTYFAEQGRTTITQIQTTAECIGEALYAMSNKNFDLWTDNLVIEIL